jgi:undecaprenyl-diphosphatase
MLFSHIVLLALIQGITEFLPISSTAHLVLLHNLFDSGIQDAQENRMLDIAVHIGTLLAVLVYFHRDVFSLICGGFSLVIPSMSSRTQSEQRLALMVLVSSIPVIFVGFIVYKTVDPAWFYNPHIIAWTTVIFGLLLGYADHIGQTHRASSSLTLKEALLLGFMQCLSLIPGVSRSGITMTTGRFLGLSREEAARFSLLMAVVATAAVGFAGILDIIKEGNVELTMDAGIAMLLSFLSALVVIAGMMKWLAKFSFKPFVVYRLILGAGLIIALYIWPLF